LPKLNGTNSRTNPASEPVGTGAALRFAALPPLADPRFRANQPSEPTFRLLPAGKPASINLNAAQRRTRCVQKGLKMKRIIMLMAVLSVSEAIGANDSPLSQVAERLSEIANDMKPVAAVEQNGRAVSLSYNTRKFMVHNTDKLGHHSEKAHETVGPRYDGLIVKVTVQDGRYFGAAIIPLNLRRPYWTTFVNAYPIAKGKQHLHVNISYGSRTDRELIKRIKDMLESMIDDDPHVTARELGVHNKPLQDTSQ